MEGQSVAPRRGRVASYMDATASSRAATVGAPAETKRTGASKKATKTSTSVQRLITTNPKRTPINKSGAPSSRAGTVGIPAETKRTAGSLKKATKTSTSVQRLITTNPKRTHINKSDAPSLRAGTVAVPAETKPTAGPPKKATKTSTSVQRLITTNSKRTHINKSDALSSAPTAKQRTMTSDRSRSLGSSGRAKMSSLHDSHTAEVTAYELDIASQLYAWIFMRQALTESSNHAVADFQTTIATRVRDLEAEGDVLADYCLRIQTARESQLLDDLSRQQVYSVVPTLIQAFVLSQERCQAAMVNAIRIQEMFSQVACTVRSEIRDLDQLTGETTELYKSIVALSRTRSLDSLLATTLEGMLLVLDMRIENLELSRKVLATVWDNEALEIGEPS